MNGLSTLRLLGTAVFTMFVGLSVAACEGETTTTSTGGSGGGGGGGNAASNGEQYARAICDRVFDCCNTAELAERFSNNSVVDYAGCRILYRTIWEAAIEPVVKDGESAGRVSFNQANFDKCMATVGDLSCADFSLGPVDCEDVFTPKVAAGGACYSDLECIDEECDIPNGASMGTCIAKPTPVGMGGACTENDGCESGLYCNGMTCEALKADGQDCVNDDECLAGTCVGDAQGMGKCGKVCEGGGPGSGPVDTVLESIGGPFIIAQCDKAFDCCIGDELDAVLFPGMRTKAGCLSLYGAFLGLALVEMHNSVVEKKVEIDGAAFQKCIDDYDAQTCQDFSKGTGIECTDAIKGLLADGASCTDDAQCTSKYCNEPMPNQGTCATLPGAGAPCTNDCADGFYCEGGMCTAQKAAGSACSSTSECSEGRCHGQSGMKTCQLICDGI